MVCAFVSDHRRDRVAGDHSTELGHYCDAALWYCLEREDARDHNRALLTAVHLQPPCFLQTRDSLGIFPSGGDDPTMDAVVRIS